PPEVAPDGSEVEVVAHEASRASHGRKSGHPRRPLFAEKFLVGLVVDPVLVAVYGDVEAGVHKLQPVEIALAPRGAIKLRLAGNVALDRIGVDVRVTLDQPFHRRSVD